MTRPDTREDVLSLAVPAGWKLVPIEATDAMEKAAEGTGSWWNIWDNILAAAPTPPAAEAHPDDLAVDQFAVIMKAKLAVARDKGRGGWEDRETWPEAWLSARLREHVEKGDPVDVANFAMMLSLRGERIVPPAAEAPGQEPVAVKGVGTPEPIIAEIIGEHSGCGHGVQVDSITIRLAPGDRAFIARGPLGRAMLPAKGQTETFYAAAPAPPTYADAEAKGTEADGLEKAAQWHAAEAAIYRQRASEAAGDIQISFVQIATRHERYAQIVRSLASPAKEPGQ